MASRRAHSAGGREPTLTERARRAQLIDVTVEQVADHGYAGTSLARIAEGAGITKAAVLYHFPSKAAVVDAAYQHVLFALVDQVGAAVDAAGPAEAPAAYIRAMIGHLRDHPRHTRMIIEARIHADEQPATSARWQPLADLLAAAQRARGRAADSDATLRTTAIIIGGAIDAIVAERLADPGYDTAAAADQLAALLEYVVARER